MSAGDIEIIALIIGVILLAVGIPIGLSAGSNILQLFIGALFIIVGFGFLAYFVKLIRG